MENSDWIIQAVNLFKEFHIGNGRKKSIVKAVSNVTLNIRKNEVYGLVGESGCGKSTLGRTLIRLTDVSDGKIVFDGKDITALPEKVLRPYRSRMQMVFQDPYTSLNPRKRVGDILNEVLLINGINDPKERMDIVFETLEHVGLRPEQYFRYPNEFSGGQRQRIGLARALMLDTQFVVCDEPVSALDVSIQAQIVNLLLEIKEKKQVSYLFISHDINVVRYISDRIGVMYLGNLVEEAPADEIIYHSLHPYTQALLSAVPDIDNFGGKSSRILLEGDLPSPINPPSGCVFHTRCPYATQRCMEEEPKYKNIGSGHKVKCHLYHKKKEEKSPIQANVIKETAEVS